MFTGIVQALGQIRAARPGSLAVQLPDAWTGRLELGGSVCVNGVCLSVRRLDEREFLADLSSETSERTTLGRLRPGHAVNLELPLRASGRLDGHWVLGHVDTVGRVRALYRNGGSWTLQVEMPSQHASYVVEKGSIAVDGISLTPYDVTVVGFRCAIIPDTLERTVLKDRKPGDPVNLEFDILAKYVERMMHFVSTY
jgi:riboflavin synthase